MGQNATDSAHDGAHCDTAAEGVRRGLVDQIRHGIQGLWSSWLVPPFFIALSAVLVFGVYGWSLQRRESRELNSVFEENFALVLRAVEIASEHALRDRDDDRLERLIRAVVRVDEELSVLVVARTSEVVFSSANAVAMSDTMRRLVAQTVATGAGQRGSDGVGEAQVAIQTASLDYDGETDAVLVLVKPMRALFLDLQRTRRNAWAVAAMLGGATLLLSVVSLHLRIRRPLRELRAAMNQIQRFDESWDTGGLTKGVPERDIRAVGAALQSLLDRFSSTNAELDVLHRQREELANRLAENEGRARLAQFASELAHEIGSPLQVVIGRAHQLESRSDRPDDVLRNARLMIQACERVQQAIEMALRAVYRQVDQPIEIDVGDRLAQVASLGHPVDLPPDIALVLDVPKGALRVKMDADALDQILRNLVSNALEACRSTGGSVRVYHTEADDGGVALVVADTGVGISSAHQKTIWKPWVTTRVPGGGHGFGLSIVERICRDFGLGVELTSEVNVGTTIRIIFPSERVVHTDAGRQHPVPRGAVG